MAFVLAALLLAAPPDEFAPPTCKVVWKHLDGALRQVRRIKLTFPARGDGKDMGACSSFAKARRALRGRRDSGNRLETGTLGGKPASVLLEGGEGSGRIWIVTIAVEDGKGAAGSCLTTSTVGFRSASMAIGELPGLDIERPPFLWKPLEEDQFVLWTSIAGGNTGTNSDTLLVPVHYALKDRDLVYDPAATARAVGTFGEAFQSCTRCRADFLLQPAAQAYLAWSRGQRCPQ